MFVPNFITLCQAVPEKSLTEKKFTHTHTNIFTENSKNIAKVSKAHIPPVVAIRSHTTLIQKADYRKRYTAIHLMNT